MQKVHAEYIYFLEICRHGIDGKNKLPFSTIDKLNPYLHKALTFHQRKYSCAFINIKSLPHIFIYFFFYHKINIFTDFSLQTLKIKQRTLEPKKSHYQQQPSLFHDPIQRRMLIGYFEEQLHLCSAFYLKKNRVGLRHTFGFPGVFQCIFMCFYAFFPPHFFLHLSSGHVYF